MGALAVAFGLVLCGALGAASAMAATGSISGTVTDAASEDGIDNIWRRCVKVHKKHRRHGEGSRAQVTAR